MTAAEARGLLALAAGLAVAGALQTLAFVHTAGLWPLPLLGAALLAGAAARVATPGRAALLGWAYGFGWLAAGTWWLFVSMHRYGGLPAPLAAAAVAALAGALSLYLALAMAAFAALRSGRPLGDAALFASLWLLAELARGLLFTGFPWLASGYAQLDSPLAALAPWLGVYGIGAWGAAVAALAASALAGPGGPGGAGRPAGRAPAAAAAVLLLAPAALSGLTFSRPAGTVTVALVQTNIAQDEKFAAERLPGALAALAEAMHGTRAALVVAPETAVPLLPEQLEALVPGYWQALAAPFASPGRAALVGVPLGSFEAGYTNSVAGFSAATGGAARFYRYDKHHLVPFGEFIPPGFRWFTEAMNIPLGDFARGPLAAPSFDALGQRIAPNICYEDLFGEELARRFAREAQAPTVLANVSNIGWFGDTVAVPQHLAISRMRTLELERPMLRATNTGATAIVDHRGRVTAALPSHTRAVLEGEVEGREGLTPFARWASVAGLWPLVAAGFAAPVLAARRIGRARRAAHPRP